MHKTPILAAAALVVLAGCSTPAATTEPATPPATAAQTTAAAPAPSVIGSTLDVARDTLKAAGVPIVDEVDIRDGKAVLLARNWTVVEQTGDSSGVTLGVEKIADEPATEAPPAADDTARAAILETALEDAFGGDSPADVLAADPASWYGYLAGVRVAGGNAWFTLQTSDRDLGEQAARALSTLLPAEAVDGIDWLIVEDGAGTVMAQEQPAPHS